MDDLEKQEAEKMKNFDFNAEDFSYQNSLALLEAAELAYEDEDNIYAKTKDEWGFDECKFIENSETQCYIAKNENIILLAFRGTESDKIIDILVDLFALKKKIFWGKAHVGFYAALDVVFKEICLTLKELQDNQQPIWIAGHSLGGALATLAAARLAYEGEIKGVKGVYTYGQPLVGNKEFKTNFENALKGKFYRLTNFKDPVSLVPLKCWRFHHVGKIMLFNEQGEAVDKSPLWVRFSLILIPLAVVIIAFFKKKSEFCKKKLGEIASPHALLRYRENILKNGS